MAEPAPRNVRFVDSMPRPLLVIFLVFAVIGLSLVVWLFASPPNPELLAVEERRSPPKDSLTHDVFLSRPVSIPTPLPSFTASCPTVRGLVVEGGQATVDRIARALGPVCAKLQEAALSSDVVRSLRALQTSRVRFALFKRTGELSTTDLDARRVLLAVALSRTNAPAGPIALLLIHEGYHLSFAGPVTAAQEFGARRAEYEACRVLLPDRRTWPRGCDDALAVVRLGEARAVESLVRAGYPR